VGQLALILHLADNALILGQRNAEWCGHGPVLEEDIAMANLSLDLIGQARLLYQHAATLEGSGKTEDHYAYWRGEAEFRNFTLCELPHHIGADARSRTERDYAVTVVRNAIWSAYMLLLWPELAARHGEGGTGTPDAKLSAIAAKSAKEAAYHWRHARDWFVRLGDGTDESHGRMQRALAHWWPYTAEFWIREPQLRERFEALMRDAAHEATLSLPSLPATPTMAARASQGLHSEHMGYLLAEMQSVARAHPGATW
jgi:ring-1,2-phenylacetyl-CoA epoxidase subunit PaaC